MNIAILGGAFDPIHNGHIALCKSALDLLPIQQFFFIPSFNHPFKGIASFFTFEERCELINLAIKENFPNNSYITVNEIEKQTPGENFTYLTLNKLHNQYPYSTLYFILGTDNLKAIHLWKNIDQILKLAKLACFKRKGFDMDAILKVIDSNNTPATMEAIRQNIYDFDGPEVSSTEIKVKINSNKSLEGLTPTSVINKIKEYKKTKK